MNAGQSVGIDLPLKMLMWEAANGDVIVSTNVPEVLLGDRHGLEGVDTQIGAARGATLNFLDAATADE